MTKKFSLNSSKKLERELSFLAAGLDSEISRKALENGYTLTKLKTVSQAELRKIFSTDEMKKISTLRRKPIAEATVRLLIEKSHWKCCVCWEYNEIRPVIIHHIIEHSKTQDDSYENLVVLCLNHHAEAHSKWEISRHPLSPDVLRHKKVMWERALADFENGTRLPPSSKSQLYSGSNPETPFWDDYLKYVVEKFKKWHIPDEISILIDWDTDAVPIDKYIRLSDKGSLLASMKNVKGGKRNPKTITLTNALLNQFIIVIGSAGSGKSTSLRYINYTYALNALQRNSDYSANTFTPALVLLRHYGHTNILDSVYSQFSKFQVVKDRPSFENLLRNTKLILLLDGLDEVQTKWRTDLHTEISTIKDTYPNIQLVITSRRHPQPGYLEGFVGYEIVKLEQSIALIFAEAYLGHYNRYAFMHFIEQHRLEDVVQSPLLLAFCIILFRKDENELYSLADIYTNILNLFKLSWEDKKKFQSVEEPIAWKLLERTLSSLAYNMVIRDIGNSITTEQALMIFAEEAKILQAEFSWSIKHTTLDLLAQLLAHNLLEISEDILSFWHTSIQDFFTALHVSAFPITNALELVNKEKLNSQTIAFLGGLLDDPSPLVNLLVEEAWSADHFSAANRPVEILGTMGARFTGEILRIMSNPDFIESMNSAYVILEDRIFPGKEIFTAVSEIVWTIDGIETGILSLEDFSESFPNPDQIDSITFSSLYSAIMSALSKEDVQTAGAMYSRLQKYLSDLIQEEISYDYWLEMSNLNDLDTFSMKLRSNEINLLELHAFCNTTIYYSSLPFLQTIIDVTDNFDLRMEASVARQCIIRR